MPSYLLKLVPSRHALEYVLKHVANHLFRHMPDRHRLEQVPGRILRHVPKHQIVYAVLMTQPQHTTVGAHCSDDIATVHYRLGHAVPMT